MGLFNFGKPNAPQPPPEPGMQLPIKQIDLTKRYDVYCFVSNEERLYENVKFIGSRTFDRPSEFLTGISGFLEIEAADGSRLLIPRYGIQLLCEHGTEPVYKIIKNWGPRIPQ